MSLANTSATEEVVKAALERQDLDLSWEEEPSISRNGSTASFYLDNYSRGDYSILEMELEEGDSGLFEEALDRLEDHMPPADLYVESQRSQRYRVGFRKERLGDLSEHTSSSRTNL